VEGQPGTEPLLPAGAVGPAVRKTRGASLAGSTAIEARDRNGPGPDVKPIRSCGITVEVIGLNATVAETAGYLSSVA
jgi:hypothetical protein